MVKKKITSTKIKNYASGGLAGVLLFSLFAYLISVGSITINGYSGDMSCEGTIGDPCYAYVNFTANEDITVAGSKTWNVFNTSSEVKSIYLEVYNGVIWKRIDTTKQFNFSNGEDYQIRFVGLKFNPEDIIKWSFGNVDPYWESPKEVSGERKFIVSEKSYINSYGYLKSDLLNNGTLEITKWNNTRLTIGVPKFATTQPKKNVSMFNSSRIDTTLRDMNITWYPTKIGELPGLEYEIVLNKKPTTNVLTFPIKSEGLNFYYQPPLNQEYNNYTNCNETDCWGFSDRNSHRPENVIGSYAVFGNNKNNQYETGKVTHIYRPWVVSNNGSFSWCNQTITATLWRITCPMEYLDTGSKIGPTFGYTTTPGSYAEHGGPALRILTNYTPADAGTVTNISIYYGGATTSVTVRPVIYYWNGSAYRNLTHGAEMSTTPGVWNNGSVNNVAIDTSTNYGLGFWYSGTQDFGYDSGARLLRRMSPAYSSTNPPPDPFVQVASIASSEYGVYATYTTGGGDTTAPKWQTNTSNSTLAGSYVLHSVNWTDETALSGYIFSFDNGTGTFTNDSWVSFTGTQNWSNVSKVINSTIGTTIQWKVYANDSSNNKNVTSTFSYVTTSSGLDTTAPKFQNIGINNTTPNILDSVKFSVNWTDEIQLANYTFSWNATGTNCDTWENDSAVTFIGVSNWSNITKQIPAPCVGRVSAIGWKVYAKDNSSNMNVSTTTNSFTTTNSALNITQVTPIANANWTSNAFTLWTSNVCCVGSDCGTVNVSLDPATNTATETVNYSNATKTDDSWMGTEGGADCYCNNTADLSTCGNSIAGRANDAAYVGINFGGYDMLYNGHETGHRQDILLKFPQLATDLPYQKVINGSTYTLVIENATIRLTSRSASFDGGQNGTIFFNQTMHKVLKQWVEGGGMGYVTGCPNTSGVGPSYNWSSNKYAVFPTVPWDDYQTWDAKFPANATTDRVNPPFAWYWLTNQTFNITDCLGAMSTCVKANWTVPPSIVLDWIQNPSTNYGVKIQSNIQSGSSEGELFWFASERGDDPELQQPKIIITYHYTANLKGGLVNTTAGASPFYTNGSNPQTVTLNKDQCTNVSWWVNSTGTVGDEYEFYAYANVTNNTAIYNQTGVYNITIALDPYPTFSNFEDNNDSNFMDIGTGIFNVTVADTNGTVWLTIEDIGNRNVSATSLGNGKYTVTYPFYFHNNWGYHWNAYGNGDSHFKNSSSQRNLTIGDTNWPKYEFHQPGLTGASLVNLTWWVGQTFRVGDTGTNVNYNLTAIGVYFCNTGSPTCNVSVSVRNGTLNSEDLAISTNNMSAIYPNTYPQCTATTFLFNNYTLNASTNYSFIFKADGCNGVVYPRIAYGANGYVNGSYYRSNDSGATWTSSAVDIYFATYGINTTAPSGDTCTCPGSGNNWQVDMEDMCTLSTACDLGTGNLTWIGTSGYFNCSAELNLTRRSAPPSNTIFYFKSGCRINH